jgi:hypothetical protein
MEWAGLYHEQRVDPGQRALVSTGIFDESDQSMWMAGLRLRSAGSRRWMFLIVDRAATVRIPVLIYDRNRGRGITMTFSRQRIAQ